MDQINVLDKIHFHKQTSEVLYADLLKYFLDNKNLESKVSKLEDQLKKKKAMNKGWKIQVKKLEMDLTDVRKMLDSKKPVKKLFDEKDKTINSLKK